MNAGATRPLALVTGASAGIGRAFAVALAERGYDVVAVARRGDRLESLAAEIAAKNSGATVHAVAYDLSGATSAERLASEVATRGLAVDLLVNNAGFGTSGYFTQLDPVREADEIALNCATLVALTHAFTPGMLARRRGGVINVASTAAFQPVPYMAVYGATKAFVLSFSLALHEELRTHGVVVLALCPGATETEFFEVAGTHARTGAGRNGIRSAAEVVATALAALDRRSPLVVDGWRNRALAFVSWASPRPMVTAITARLFKPRST